MRHLTTEELLLHCDDALAPERATHARECTACRDAWINLQAVLCDAEEAIRGMVPSEPLENRIASRQALERALYPARIPTGFHLRWSAVYAVAAALTFMVLSGYWSTRHSLPDSPPAQLAVTRPPVAPASTVAGEPGATAAQPAARAATPLDEPQPLLMDEPLEQILSASLVAPNEESSEPDSAVPSVQPLAVDPPQTVAATAQDSLPTPASSELQLARLEAPNADLRQAQESQVASIEPAALPTTHSNTQVAELLSAPIPSKLTSRAQQEPARWEALLADLDPSRDADPAALPKLVEGYWILTQARVWQEDLHPVWTSQGLRIEGTVENSAARNRVENALLRQEVQPLTFNLRLRQDLTDATPRGDRSARVIRAVYSGPTGGPVRRSLLGHFADAARRSFVAPGASALEAELVRYVSEIYRYQSELLAHVYALQGFLGRMDAGRLAAADASTTRKFRDVVHFHLQGIDEKEAAIYDRLSEALPRKVWSHRSADDDSGEAVNWREESDSLLRDTLELDSNLTALFGGSSLTVDAADPDQSCGELLNRIRTHLRRIKNRTQAL